MAFVDTSAHSVEDSSESTEQDESKWKNILKIYRICNGIFIYLFVLFTYIFPLFLIDQNIQSIAFLYQLTSGISLRSYGLNVARLAGIPKEVVQLAYTKSVELENKIKAKEEEKRIAVSE